MEDQETRARILGLAQEQFTQFGFSRVTMDDLASDLGISKKTLYKEFRSKDDLLRSVIQMQMQMIGQGIDRIIASPAPFMEKFTSFLSMLAGTLPRFSRHLQTDLKRKAPNLWQEMESFREKQINSKLSKLFQQGLQEGYIRTDIHYDVFTRMVLLCVQGIVNPEVLTMSSFSASEAARSIFSILFEGVLTTEARRSFRLSDIFTLQNL